MIKIRMYKDEFRKFSSLGEKVFACGSYLDRDTSHVVEHKQIFGNDGLAFGLIDVYDVTFNDPSSETQQAQGSQTIRDLQV